MIKEYVSEVVRQYKRGLIMREEMVTKVIELLMTGDDEAKHWAGHFAILLHNSASTQDYADLQNSLNL